MTVRDLAIRVVLLVAAVATVATSQPEDDGPEDGRPEDDRPEDDRNESFELTADIERLVTTADSPHVSVSLNRAAIDQAEEIWIEFQWPEGEKHDVVTVIPDSDLAVLRLVSDDPVALEATSLCPDAGRCRIGFTLEIAMEEINPDTARVRTTARLFRSGEDFTTDAAVEVLIDDD